MTNLGILHNNLLGVKEHPFTVNLVQLRALQVEMDQAVAAAYGWDDLDLGHGFHDTPQGVRYTIHTAARDEVLDRLLQLNQERYEEEVRAGLWEGKGKRQERLL